ncbi:MAG: hypothetical protein ACI3ZJ_04210 [Bacteroidaceae bacterium]
MAFFISIHCSLEQASAYNFTVFSPFFSFTVFTVPFTVREITITGRVPLYIA